MVRKQDVSDDDMPSTRSRKKRRTKRRYKVLLLLAIACLVLVLAAPSILTSRSILLPLIDKYAGIAPLKVDFTRVSAGWFSRVGIEGLRITDAQGNSVAKVGSIQTEKACSVGSLPARISEPCASAMWKSMWLWPMARPASKKQLSP